MKQTLITFVLTSLLWFCIYQWGSRADGADSPSGDYSELIVGEWEPVEEAESKLKFSKYGVMTHHKAEGFLGLVLNNDYPYHIQNNQVTITSKNEKGESEEIVFGVEIYSDEDYLYLEIYGVTQLSGKYRRALNASNPPQASPAASGANEKEQPKKTSAVKSSGKSSQTATPAQKPSQATTQKPANQAKPVQSKEELPQKSVAHEASQTSPIQPVADQSEESSPQPKQNAKTSFSTALAGKWEPVESAANSLEFTPYGTVIQRQHGMDFRYTFSTNGNRMKISYDDATYQILVENGNVYLDIYDSSDYSGRYKKIADAKKISARQLSINEYAEKIVGKWSPVAGQKFSLEFTRFNTAIQRQHGMDFRYDYKLTGDKVVIAYDRKVRVVISEDNQYYYLEIFNTKDYSGLYRRAK